MTADQIVVIDDEEMVRELICEMLESAGYSCVPAGSAGEAIQHLQESEPAMVISDLMLEDSSGLDLLDYLRPRYPDLPIVVVTGLHDLSVALSAIRKGAYDFILKPFGREQLLATTRRAVERHQLIRENRAYQTSLEALVAARTEQLRSAMHDLEQSYDYTLEALGGALDLRDTETEGHCKRVTAFTVAIGRQMGVSKEKIRNIARGAFLHDLGKMAIPDSILKKPDKLDENEWVTMREHSLLGYKMVSRIPFLQEAAEIVYAHQERWDGKGYPRGLRGEAIPLGARMFAVADTLDAICSDRPYRRGQSFGLARDEIVRCSGTQFDPKVVDAFLQIPEERWVELRHEIEVQLAEEALPVAEVKQPVKQAEPLPARTGS
jgi:putative nucleotidyltransferase with HDIG domain